MTVAELAAKLGLDVDKGAWAEGTKRISAMKVAIAAGLTVAIGAAIGKFKELALEAADYGANLDDAARKTGASTQFLEELAFAAGGVEENLGRVSDSMLKMSLQLKMAVKNPASDAAQALKKLGISLDDPRVQMGDVEGIANQVAFAFENMSDGVEKNFIAMSLMSKSGPELSKAFSELSEKRKTFAELGGALTDREVGGLDSVKESIENLAAGWTALKTKAIAAVAPELAKLGQTMTQFFIKNRESISKAIGTIVKTLASAFVGIVKAFQAVSEWVDRNRDTITKVWTGLVVTAKVLGQLIGWLVTKLIGFSQWLGETVAKIVLWVESVRDAVGGFFTSVKAIATQVQDFFVGVGATIMAVWERIIGWVQDKVEWVTDKVKVVTGALSKIGGAIGGAANAVGDFFTGDRSSQPQATVTDAFTRGFAASAPPPANGNNVTSITGSPVTVNVTAGNGMNPVELARMVAQKTKEVMDAQLRTTHETLVTVGR